MFSLSIAKLANHGQMNRNLFVSLNPINVHLKPSTTISNSLIKKRNSRLMLISNLMISMGFSGGGDLIRQIKQNECKNWDKQSIRNQAISGFFTGYLCHSWYQILDRIPFQKVKLYKCMHLIGCKILLTQTILSPTCLAVFFITNGLLNESNWREIKKNVLIKGKEIYLTELCVWPTAYFFSFLFLSNNFRVLFDNLVSFGFDIYNSFVLHKD